VNLDPRPQFETGRARSGAGSAVDVSVLIPALNEADSLRELIPALFEVLRKTGRSHEIVVVDDGSSDGTLSVLQGLVGRYPGLRALSLRRNFGKSAALATGFAECAGRTIVTLDADLCTRIKICDERR
jgi:glycosyltransferase involved in cell wall biosynthesis